MKTPTILISVVSLGLGSVLTSCVDPYAAPQTQVTHYHSGYEVRALPRGYRTEVYEGTPYYVHDNTYYRSRGGRYVVVDAPRRGDGPRQRDNRYYNRSPRSTQITKLPPGHRTVRYKGADYYQVQDTYYQRSGPGYIVVKRPY
ncbi:MAG: hypothetical protein EOP88_04880 [Verrucomicrobiaceae bacterium]|nr:MAG: hypothetical protein EOP88_04880 [Verrucomicrobiaceae bacterium]